MNRLLSYGRSVTEDVIRLTRRLVECESPSDSPEHVNRLVDLLTQSARGFAEAERVSGGTYGDHLLLRFGAGLPGRPILCLGHADTVWPAGTLDKMPFRIEDGRMWGPGVLDMKAGIAMLLFAVKAVELRLPVTLLVVSDEEIGSPSSRPLTEALARESECVLVLEPGTGLSGKLKTARKGVGRYVVRARGRAAHAGLDFENGANAIVELARQIERIAAMSDAGRGVTVNPGVIRGGTRSNVVPEMSEIEVDVRVPSTSEAERIDQVIRALRAVDTRCVLSVDGGMNRPPMERTEAIANLFARARAVATEFGVALEESASGGGSDGSFTAALGVPTLDGLGAVGEGAHAVHESVLIGRVADRIALLAGLIASFA